MPSCSISWGTQHPCVLRAALGRGRRSSAGFEGACAEVFTPRSCCKGCADKCFFGPRCRFLHDVGEYMALKPPDLGHRCVLFETFGKCTYGVTCRFAQAHLGDGFQNIINTELAKQWEGKALVRNNLSKELQHQLRKRKFSFKRAEEFLCALAKPRGDGRKGGKATGCSAEEQEVSDCTAPQEGHGEDPACPVLPEQGEDPKADGLQSPSPTDDEEASSIQTVGPVTDEDVIKLRPCEKKKVRIWLRAALAWVPDKRPLSLGERQAKDRAAWEPRHCHDGKDAGIWCCPWGGTAQSIASCLSSSSPPSLHPLPSLAFTQSCILLCL